MSDRSLDVCMRALGDLSCMSLDCFCISDRSLYACWKVTQGLASILDLPLRSGSVFRVKENPLVA